MQSQARRRCARIVVAVLLIIGGLGALGFQLLWVWGFTDSANWGFWGKPQTHEQHVGQFLSHLVRFYWAPVLGSVAAITAGVLVWSWRKQRLKFNTAENRRPQSKAFQN